MLGLAGLPLNDDTLRLLAHHAIMEANKTKMNGQKQRVKVSVLVIFDVWIGLKLVLFVRPCSIGTVSVLDVIHSGEIGDI